MNPDLERGVLFKYRAKELFAYLKKKTESGPYYGTDDELAKTMFIGYRSIARYLRFLKASGQIETIVCATPVEGSWVNRRKIILTNQGRSEAVVFCLDPHGP